MDEFFKIVFGLIVAVLMALVAFYLLGVFDIPWLDDLLPNAG